MNPQKLQKKVCIISSFPPSKCGIGTYANEQLDRLQEVGVDVLTVSMLPDSRSDLHFDFGQIAGSLRWLSFCLFAQLDSVFVHYADAYYFPYDAAAGWFARLVCRILQSFGLRFLSLKAGKESVLIIHELMTGASIPFLTRLYKNLAFGGFARIEFHTESGRRQAMETYSSITGKNTYLINHARHMKPKFFGDQNSARESLGLPKDRCIFLCLGFIAYSKGFDIAVKAFCKASPKNARLHIVGSLGNQKDAADYGIALRELSSMNGNVQITEQFVDDSTFDCWLQAADVVILPYRSISSSGVGARAAVYDKPLLISDLPGLKESFPNGTVFRDENHLSEILSYLTRAKK
jgi:glycosyltransferase involved in cell wall biosynthesis